MRIYLDNASTTPLAPQVLDEMLPFIKDTYGNPSSIHSHGRTARIVIERARKQVAELLNASPSEIFFTSGGTEADNTILFSSVYSLGVKHIITSPIEHHAVLHSCDWIQKQGLAQIHYVKIDDKGVIDYESLKILSEKYPGALVSLMHANNELGNISKINLVSDICKSTNCYFHSDTVQTIGHLKIDLKATAVDFIVGAAHKFNGPKGVGFMYNREKLAPYIHGGVQERNMRGGTENLYGIVGLAKALELALQDIDAKQRHLAILKASMIKLLQEQIPDVSFNGDWQNTNEHLSKIINVTFPKSTGNDLMLFSLDIEGVSASGGSACASGSSVGSHVLQAIMPDSEKTTIRFSFGHQNTLQEIDKTVEILKNVYHQATL